MYSKFNRVKLLNNNFLISIKVTTLDNKNLKELTMGQY